MNEETLILKTVSSEIRYQDHLLSNPKLKSQSIDQQSNLILHEIAQTFQFVKINNFMRSNRKPSQRFRSNTEIAINPDETVNQQSSLDSYGCNRTMFIERGVDTSYGKNSKIPLYKTEIIANNALENSNTSLYPNFHSNTSKMKEIHKISNMFEQRINLEELEDLYEISFAYGLSDNEAKRRLKHIGQNRITNTQNKLLKRIVKSGVNSFNIMHLVACSLSFIIFLDGVFTDYFYLFQGVVILLFLVISTYLTYRHTEQRFQFISKLKQISFHDEASVIRNGQKQKIPAKLLVPGDIVEINQNENIPADIRIISSNQLMVNREIFTGDNEPIQLESLNLKVEDILEARNMAFFGTSCVYGSGQGVVIRTGNKTLLGKLSTLTNIDQSSKQSTLQKEIYLFTKISSIIAMGSSLFGVLYWYFCIEISRKPINFLLSYVVQIILAKQLKLIKYISIPMSLLFVMQLSLKIISKELTAKGILLKNSEYIDRLANISILLIDKEVLIEDKEQKVAHIWFNSTIYSPGDVEVLFSQNRGLQVLLEVIFLCLDLKQALILRKSDEQVIEEFLLRILQSSQLQALREKQIIKRGNYSDLNKFQIIVVEENQNELSYSLYFMGAPEILFDMCKFQSTNNEKKKIDPDCREEFKRQFLDICSDGETVIGFTSIQFKTKEYQRGYQFNIDFSHKFNFKTSNMVFLGMVTLKNPIKCDWLSKLIKLKLAGVRTILMTYDHPATALSLANKANLVNSFNESSINLVTGEDLENLYSMGENVPEDHCDKQLLELCKSKEIVYARVTSAQKLIVLSSYQKCMNIVGFTAFHINDSPCLSQSDIGIAFGGSSVVCKETANLVLLNQNDRIDVAILEGKRYCDNIIKQFWFIISIMMGQVIPSLIMMIFGVPLSLTSGGIIFIQIVVVGLISPTIIYEDAEIFISQTRLRSQKLLPNKEYYRIYFIMGVLAASSGFICYVCTFQQFGFQLSSLIKMNYQTSYSNRINLSNDLYPYNKYDPHLGNQNLQSSLASENICNQDDENVKNHEIENPFMHYQDYKYITENNLDIRNVIVECGPCTEDQISLDPQLQGRQCWINTFENKSSPSCQDKDFNTNCYTLLTLDFAQGSYAYGMILWSWVYLLLIKYKNTSFRYSKMNKQMYISLFASFIIGTILIQLPYVIKQQNLNQFLPIQLLGFPAMPFIILTTIFQEITVKKNIR